MELKDKLILKLVLENAALIEKSEHMQQALDDISMRMTGIGGVFNDCMLEFTPEQQNLLRPIMEITETNYD